jgi:hypothetical protein
MFSCGLGLLAPKSRRQVFFPDVRERDLTEG